MTKMTKKMTKKKMTNKIEKFQSIRASSNDQGSQMNQNLSN